DVAAGVTASIRARRDTGCLPGRTAGSGDESRGGWKMSTGAHPLTVMGPMTDSDRPGASPVAATAVAFAAAVDSGRLDLPLPGDGRTAERWAALAELAEEDLSLARLAEGHTDALAILAELGALTVPPTGSRWGVWAA